MGSEIIEVVERRRRWPVEVRLRILDEALQRGASVAAVADRHGVARGLVYQWLRQVREGRMPGLSLKPEATATFAPVSIVPEASDATKAKLVPTPPPASGQPASPPALTSRRRSGVVEIRLANGRVMKADEDIDPAALARLVAALDGGCT
jgi:transposase